VARKRIGLTMKSGAIDRTARGPERPSSASSGPRSSAPPPPRPSTAPAQAAENAFAAALRRAQERK
jgi:protein Tex